jgi:hypothetical protein|tara:strand:- start:133 stop:429 length:297 start_codon:yes stop_codon:yes gene_type:complete
MICKECGHKGHPIRSVVLTWRVLTDDDGRVIKKLIKYKDIPFHSLKEWVTDEANSETVDTLWCANCDEELQPISYQKSQIKDRKEIRESIRLMKEESK